LAHRGNGFAPPSYNPHYLHDQRLLTLDDMVEFFNLMLGDRLTARENQDLVGVHVRAL
jgi:hypothetical protein